jgi:protease IV
MKLACMPTVLRLLPLLWMATPTVSAGPFDSSFDDLTSVSSSYGARDARINPAALAYDSELNGSYFQTVLNAAIQPNEADDYGLGFSYGPVGFHFERQSNALDRYQFSLGGSISSQWFVGHRFSLNRFPNSALSYDAWDTGLQYRPSRRIAFGLVINRWNTPPSGGVKLPAEFVLGSTVRVADFLNITVDGRTLSGASEFMKRFQGQIASQWTVSNGIHLFAGYHTVREWQFGLQLDFDYGSVVSNAVPRAANRTYAFGITGGALAQKSLLAPPTILHLKLDPSLAEDGNPAGLFRSERPSLLSLLEKIRRAPESGNIRNVFVEIESFPLGLAAAQEIHLALLDLRTQGIAVEAHLGQAGLKEYLIASAAAKIHMEPEGELRFLGVKAERYYIKGTLDKVGIEGQFLARGKFKSAPEMFTRTESSPASRQATWDELDRAEAVILAMLSKARGITTNRWTKMQQTALYSSQQAIDEKLIDSVMSFRSTKETLDDKLALSRTVERRSSELALPDRIAVVVAEGNILQNRTPLLAMGGQSQVTPERFQKKLQRALRDDRTRAILVRVSSPGGEVMASQQLADLVKNARVKKPVIVSMGDVAASGGYYMAAPADKIFVSPLTLTGSIGVFLGKFHFAGLYSWLKVNKEITTRSPYPGLFSEDRRWTGAEMQVLDKRLNSYYDSFVGFVAKSRGITAIQAEEAAQGRVWLGDQARNLKLADNIGGYLPALRYAAEMTDSDLEHTEFWEIQSSGGFFPWSEEWADAKTADAVGQVIGDSALRELLWAPSLQKNPYLYLSPVKRLE